MFYDIRSVRNKKRQAGTIPGFLVLPEIHGLLTVLQVARMVSWKGRIIQSED
jgi:hypothetical protein